MKVMNLAPKLLKSGMVLFEDIYSKAGAVILHKGTVLDDRHMGKIELNRVERVRVILPENCSISAEEIETIKSAYDRGRLNEFKNKYAGKVDEVTYVIKEIGRGASVNIQEINQLGRHIIREFETISDVINYLHLVKPMDDYTYAHSLNVSLMSIIIAKWIGMDDDALDEIATAGLLHDIGKTKIPDSLLAKPGKLTESEFEEIKKHTVLGYLMLENVKDATGNIRYSILMHHEKIDGSGYPTGAADNEIPLFPKIIAIADIYDAMTSNRSYRKKMCPFEVIKNFEMQTFGKLDTKVLTVFLKNIANSYLGDYVELNTGELCEVVFINPGRVWQPIVKFGDEFIDLSLDNKRRYIKAIV
ncbi:MAG: HD-GYP domain-containing protein [Caulobacteraceae bacterium]